jgi:hypothetical protein
MATRTPFDVVGHLIYGERADWMPRVRMILEFGDSRTFEPFDMSGHIRVCKGKSLGQLLDEFSQLRAANLADLKALHLRSEDLERRGLHPALGPVTMSQLLARSRSDASPSDLPDYGAPIQGGGVALGRIYGRHAVCWAQLCLSGGPQPANAVVTQLESLL